MAAHHLGPRFPPPRPHHRPRRAHQLDGPLGRSRLAQPFSLPGRRPHRPRHHPPFHHRPPRRYCLRHGRRPHRRVRSPLHPGRRRRPLCRRLGCPNLGTCPTLSRFTFLALPILRSITTQAITTARRT